jgi:nucleotide-binding universal stress UspA family protein
VTGPDAAPYGHVAVCLDRSEASARGLAEARRLRGLGPGRLSMVHALPRPLIEVATPGGIVASPRDVAVAEGTWLRRRAAEVAGAEPVAVTGNAPEAVLAWAETAGPDLLVAAAHRGPLERALLGSFAAHVALRAPCPVLLTR